MTGNNMNENIKIAKRSISGFPGEKALFAIDKRNNTVICFRRYTDYYDEYSNHIFKSEEWEAESLEELEEWFKEAVERFLLIQTR